MTDNNILDLLSLADDKYISESFPQVKRAPVFTLRRVYALAASVCVIATAAMAGILIPSLSNDLPLLNLPEDKPLEYGLKFGPGDGVNDFFNPAVCAYKSDTNIFDIDNVTLKFYFGYIIPDYATIEYLLETTVNVPTFDIYFEGAYYTGSGENLYDYEYSEKFLVKTSDMNLISEEYRVTEVYNEEPRYIQELVFNHSEILNIPQELFKGEYGMIYFRISGVDLHGSVAGFIKKTGGSVHFGYDKIGSKIIIYKPSDWVKQHSK